MEQFEVVRELGSGAAGVAHLVLDRATQQPFVMKTIPLLTQELRDRSVNEVRVLRTLDHPNVVRFRSSFFEGEALHIVMERCEMALDHVLEQCAEKAGFLQERVLVEWMTELLCAVQAVHQRGVIHRDIKTSNVFLSRRNHAKLGDFGVCKVVGGGLGATNATVGALDGPARTVVGTPYYIAPEVFDEAEYDSKSDVWSLGVVFYEMCAMRRPFTGNNIVAVMHDITTNDPPPLPPHVDRRFGRILRLMLSKDPARRPTAQQLLDKFFVLPLSHPSHPCHGPSESRAIQSNHGPSVVVAPAVPTPGPKPSEAPGFKESSRLPPTDTKPTPKKASRHRTTVGSAGTRTAHFGRLTPKRTPPTTGHLSPEEHAASLARIRNARSRVDVSELRRARPPEGDDVVFVPLSVITSPAPPGDPPGEASGGGTPSPAGSELATLQDVDTDDNPQPCPDASLHNGGASLPEQVVALLRAHPGLCIDDVDAVAEALGAFKLDRFGYV